MVFRIDGVPGPMLAELNEKLLGDLLTSDDEESRVKGRLLATNVVEELHKFARAEARRETPPHLVVMAISQVLSTYIGSTIVAMAKSPKSAVTAAAFIAADQSRYLNQMVEMAAKEMAKAAEKIS